MPLRGDSSLDCEEARELTRGFLSGGGMLDRRAEWRAHLAACQECDEQYRETVEMLSRLHRARREAHESEGDTAQAPELPETAQAGRRSLIAFSPAPLRLFRRPRKRAGWLALAIPFAALLVFGALGLPGEEPRAANARALQGAIEVDEQLLGAGDPARGIAPGSLVVAAAASRVRLQDERSELVLEGEGMLRCQGFGPLRVHLYGGHLAAQGECRVSTAVGVVHSAAGALELWIEASGLRIRAGPEGASFQDGSGLRPLAPGAELTVPTPAVPAASR